MASMEDLIDAKVAEGQSKALLRLLEAQHQREQRFQRDAFRQTMWLAAIVVASVASAAGLVIAVLR